MAHLNRKSLLFATGLLVSVSLALTTANPAHAFGRGTFKCEGAEYSQNWFGKETFIRELQFELTALSVDGKNYTVRFMGRALNGKFSGKNIGNKEEKFVLFHDQPNNNHKLTYEMENKNLIKANCKLVDYH